MSKTSSGPMTARGLEETLLPVGAGSARAPEAPALGKDCACEIKGAAARKSNAKRAARRGARSGKWRWKVDKENLGKKLDEPLDIIPAPSKKPGLALGKGVKSAVNSFAANAKGVY